MAGVTATSDQQATVDREVAGLFGRDSLYVVSWAVQIIAAAVVTPVVTRLMGPVEFGRTALSNAVMQTLFVVAGLGLQTAIQRHHARADGAVEARKILSAAIAVAAVVTVVVDLTGPLWSPLIGLPSYSGAIRLAVVWAGVSAVTNSALALLRSQDRLLPFVVVNLFQSLVAEVLSLLLVGLVSPTAKEFILGQLLAQVAATVVALALVVPHRLGSRDVALVREALAYAIPLVPAVLGSLILASADRLVIGHDLGQAEVARYQIAYNVGALPMLLLSLLDSAWMPRFFALADRDTRGEVLAASRDFLYRLLVPVVVGLSIGAPVVLRVWAPASYHPEKLLLVTSVVIVTVIPYTAGIASIRTLLLAGRTRVIAGATVVAAVLNIVLNLLLVPRFHLVASAASTLAAFVVLQLLLERSARAVVVLRPVDRRTVRQLWGAGALALAAAAAPISLPLLVIRSVLAAAAAGWFFTVLRRPAR